ncbi:MAG TPA: RsmD family RNA methyltransferase [Thermoanaerobaculia bacterium]
MTGRSARRGPDCVRIQAGRWKGRALAVPASARPTSGRARAALFNMLSDRLPGARVLDLYAGSGAVGLEAVSRGAVRAVLVEPDAGSLLRDLARWKIPEEEVLVLREPAARALSRLSASRERFDLVFADPPYADAARPDELAGIVEVLDPKGIAVVQTDARSRAPTIPGLRATASRAYGRNVFHFLGVFDATARKC